MVDSHQIRSQKEIYRIKPLSLSPQNLSMSAQNPIFNRLNLLLGEETMERVMSKRVIIFGVGGVGSWCAESLVRSGISHLTIVHTVLSAFREEN